MKLKDYIVEPFAAGEKQLARRAKELVADFILAIEHKQSPSAMITTYKDAFSEIDNLWASTVRKHLKCGRSGKSICIQSLPSYSLFQFAEDKLNYTFHFQNFTRMQFNRDNYTEMCKMEITMLLAKYEHVYLYEIEVAIIQVLMRYFNVYSVNAITQQSQWDVTAGDINAVINYITNIDMIELKEYAKKIDSTLLLYKSRPKEQHVTLKLRPTCKEDLEQCFVEGMT